MSFDYLSFSFFVADRVIILSEITIYRHLVGTNKDKRTNNAGFAKYGLFTQKYK